MTGRVFSWALTLTCFSATSTLATYLIGRLEQTQAKCSTDYDWASNSLGLSPCLLSAFVWGSCFTGNWDVPQLQLSQSYTNPNATTANLCSCSWAAYNLLSACTACQGFTSAVEDWAAYEQSCGDFLTDTYFPENVSLPAGTAIPYWAGADPRTWNDGRFNTSQAILISQQQHPDFVQGSSAGSKRMAPIAAIVGGVVGGVAVLGTIAFLCIRKRNHEKSSEGEIRPYPSSPHILTRIISDATAQYIVLPQSISAARSHKPGTIRTHADTGSLQSLWGSGGTPPLSAQLMNEEGVIEPLTMRSMSQPVSMRPAATREVLNSTLHTSSNQFESSAAQEHTSLLENSEDADMDPPAYSRYPSPASTPEPIDPRPLSAQRDFAPDRQRHRQMDSIDTQLSYHSATSHDEGDSVSAIEDVIHRMELTMSPVTESVVGSTLGAGTVATGESVNVVSRSMPKHRIRNPDDDTLS